MATVYLAQDLRHHRQVAIKVLREDLGATIGPERFQREIEIAARLHHPHILPLYESGEAGGLLFYVMPYVQGESLRDRLAREGELPITDTVRILREVADALAKAHSQGVVHRDIKPDNVMLADRHALVADFGVAKAVSDATQASGITTVGVALGTPAYMAPEQAAADPNTDHRADVYAFGVLAYEMLNGSPPFTGKTAQQVLASHLTEAPAPVTRRRPSVPAPLAELVMRCLEKKPADRWQTADEMVSRLEAMGTPSGGMEPTRATAAVARGGAAGGRHWLVAAGIVAATALGLWATVLRGRGDPALDPDLVTVLPFRVSTTGGDFSYLREGIVDLMATLLTGEDGTARTVEPASVIAEWRQRSGGEGTDLAAPEAEALARRLGAGRIMSGSILGDENRLTIRAALATVGSRAEPIQATVEGPAADLATLTANLVGQLLAQSAGFSSEETRSLLTNSLPALRAHLGAHAEYRRGRFLQATRGFEAALQADSGFALAGVGYLMAAGWAGGTPQGEALARRAAWANLDRLGPKDRAVAFAFLGPNGLARSTLAGQLAGISAAVGVAGDRAVTWYLLGDAYFHDGLVLGVRDWPVRAGEAFRRAIARDSLEAGVLGHLVLLAAYQHDTAGVRAWASEHRRANSDSVAAAQIDWFASQFLGDRAAAHNALQRLRLGGVEGTVALAYAIGLLPQHLGEIRAAVDSLEVTAQTDGERSFLVRLRTMMAYDAGRPEEAARIAAGLPGGTPALAIQAGLVNDGDSAYAARAVEDLVARGVAGSGGALCNVALWRAANGEAAAAEAAARTLRAAEPARESTVPPGPLTLCAMTLEVMAAQRQGRPDARERVDALDRLLGQGPGADVGMEHMANLIVARLLESQGDPARAAAAARRVRVFLGYPSNLAALSWEAGRLAELAGDRERAIEGYSTYIKLRKDSEPRLQPKLQQAREALVRLTGEGQARP